MSVKDDYLKERDIAEEHHDLNHAHYWGQRADDDPMFDIYIASTNEPNLEESLSAWQKQAWTDFRVNVIVDCVEPETYGIAQKFMRDKRFRFTFSPVMQGLCHIWNVGLQSTSNYIVLAGADILHPPMFLNIARTVLSEHPEYGWIQPTVESQPEDFPLWSYVITNECARKTGLFDKAFGMGGFGMVRDWQTRAYDAGFRPKSLWTCRVEHSGYSIMDKISDLTIIEGKNTFEEKYGFPITNTSNRNIRPSPEFVDDGGKVIDIKQGLTINELVKLNGNEIKDELRYYREQFGQMWRTGNEGKPLEDGHMLFLLENKGIEGIAATTLIAEYWSLHVLPEQSDLMREQLRSVDIALTRALDMLVKNRASGIYRITPSPSDASLATDSAP